MFNKAHCCLRLTTVTQEKRGGREKRRKKKSLLSPLKQKLTRPTQSSEGETSQLNVTGPAGSSPLIYPPPFTTSPLVFSFPPRRFFTCVPLSSRHGVAPPLLPLLHLGGHNWLPLDIYAANSEQKAAAALRSETEEGEREEIDDGGTRQCDLG